jgi:hypothetical protein
MVDEPKVELSPDLLREAGDQVEEIAPRRTTGPRPVTRPGDPTRRPLRPDESRPSASPSGAASHSEKAHEKTQIRAVPEKPRR